MYPFTLHHTLRSASPTQQLTFCGYRFIAIYERYAWIPVTIVLIITVGVGGKHFQNPVRFTKHVSRQKPDPSCLCSQPPHAPATAAQVLSYAAAVAGFVISWATLAADYTIYMPSNVSKVKVFTYAYLGFFLPLCLLEILGAALINTALVYQPWAAGYEENGVSGLLAAALHPVGRFGKFCMVVLAMSMSPFALRTCKTLIFLHARYPSGLCADDVFLRHQLPMRRTDFCLCASLGFFHCRHCCVSLEIYTSLNGNASAFLGQSHPPRYRRREAF